jgi:hypothetical protein
MILEAFPHGSVARSLLYEIATPLPERHEATDRVAGAAEG